MDPQNHQNQNERLNWWWLKYISRFFSAGACVMAMILLYLQATSSSYCEVGKSKACNVVPKILAGTSLAILSLHSLNQETLDTIRYVFRVLGPFGSLIKALIQASFLLGSNLFTFLGVNSVLCIPFGVCLSLALLNLEYRLNRAYSLNPSSTMMSITMAMAVSSYVNGKLGGWWFLSVWGIAILMAYVTGKFPDDELVLPQENDGRRRRVRRAREVEQRITTN